MRRIAVRTARSAAAQCVAVALGVAALGAAWMGGASARHREAEHQKLLAVADLEAQRVATWRAARESQLAALGANPWLGPAARNLLARPEDARLAEQLSAFLGAFAESSGWRAAILARPDGRVLAASGEVPAALDDHGRALVARATAGNRELAAEPALAGEEVHVDGVVPIRDGGRAVAAVLLESRAADRLAPMLAGFPLSSASGEVLLLAREERGAVLVTDPVGAPGTALRARIVPSPEEGAPPLARAAGGAEGVVRGADAAGVRRVAAIRAVPGSPWIVVAQASAAEVDAAITERAATVVAAGAGLALALCAAIVLGSRRRAAELRAAAAEGERDREREHAAELLASLHEPVVAMDLDGRITAWNAAAERMYGWSAAEAIGAPLDEVLPSADLTAADRGALRERARAEGRCHASMRYVRRDGAVVEAELTLVALYDPAGAPTGWVCAHRDVSEQRRLQAQLAQSERLASLGALAAGMAHALNSPLASTIANVGFARDELARRPGDDDAREALDDALAGARRAAEVVRSLQLFARAGPAGGGALVDVREVVRAGVELAGFELRQRAQLALDLADAPAVRADRSQLCQLVVQLLLNACQAIPEGSAARNAIGVATRREGDDAVIEVSDTGHGIPEEVRPRIFDPFFTTEALAGRAGLGLSMCHGIVAAAGGAIDVVSAPGRGTTFRVRLPGAAAAHDAPLRAS